MKPYIAVLVSLLSPLLLGGCSDTPRTSTFIPTTSNRFDSSLNGKHSLLFVGNCRYCNPSIHGDVVVYPADGTAPVLTITKGVFQPTAFAFDRSGNLYVANNGNSVSVYASGKNQPLRTIRQGISNPDALALDRSGNLYVADIGSNEITVYAPGATKVLRRIYDGINAPTQMVFDRYNNLYVANFQNITVYNPGSGLVKRTISAGLTEVVGIALDHSGILYVCNDNGRKNGIYLNVYDPGSNEVHRKITGYAFNPMIDSKDNLYILGTAQVRVYSQGGGTLLRTISQGLDQPYEMALQPRVGNLAVANQGGNSGHGSVNVYAAGTTTLLRTITESINLPGPVIFGE